VVRWEEGGAEGGEVQAGPGAKRSSARSGSKEKGQGFTSCIPEVL
jgi:hypothetical protein